MRRNGHEQDTGEVTRLLLEARGGDRSAFDRLLPLVYEELRRLAERQLRREREGHTLQPTALVHEAYLRLVDQTRYPWEDRSQFLGIAAMAMRRVLVDHARRRLSAKRGGGADVLPLRDGDAAVDARAQLVVEVDQALGRLAELSPRLSRVVECRFFGGMSEEETAAVVGTAVRTVRRDWVKARGWLREALGDAEVPA